MSLFDPGYGGFDEDRDRDRADREERERQERETIAQMGTTPEGFAPDLPGGMAGAPTSMGLSEFEALINAEQTRGQRMGQEQVAARRGREAESARLEGLGINPARLGETGATWRDFEPAAPGGAPRPPAGGTPAAPTPRPGALSPVAGLASLYGYGGEPLGRGGASDQSGLPRGAYRGEGGSISWSDSSRGNPQPGMAYTQALIPWTPEDYARYGMPMPPVGPPRLPRIIDGEGGGAVPRGGGTSIIDRLMANYGQDLGYLRGEPFQTNEEQAMVERAKSRVRNNFAMERQRTMDEAGAMNRPLGPLLEDINRREQLALADVDQGLLAATAGERRSRLAESRGVLGSLESLERSRAAEAMGIESTLDEQERRRILDLAALMGLAPNVGEAAGISGNLLNYAATLGGQARAAQQQQYGGMGDLAYLWSMNRRGGGGGGRSMPSFSGYD